MSKIAWKKGWAMTGLFLAVILLLALITTWLDWLSVSVALFAIAIVLASIYQIWLHSVEDRKQRAADAELEKIQSSRQSSTIGKPSTENPKKRL